MSNFLTKIEKVGMELNATNDAEQIRAFLKDAMRKPAGLQSALEKCCTHNGRCCVDMSFVRRIRGDVRFAAWTMARVPTYRRVTRSGQCLTSETELAITGVLLAHHNADDDELFVDILCSRDKTGAALLQSAAESAVASGRRFIALRASCLPLISVYSRPEYGFSRDAADIIAKDRDGCIGVTEYHRLTPIHNKRIEDWFAALHSNGETDPAAVIERIVEASDGIYMRRCVVG